MVGAGGEGRRDSPRAAQAATCSRKVCRLNASVASSALVFASREPTRTARIRKDCAVPSTGSGGSVNGVARSGNAPILEGVVGSELSRSSLAKLPPVSRDSLVRLNSPKRRSPTAIFSALGVELPVHGVPGNVPSTAPYRGVDESITPGLKPQAWPPAPSAISLAPRRATGTYSIECATSNVRCARARGYLGIQTRGRQNCTLPAD